MVGSATLALIQEARAGDRLAFEALVRPLYSPAFRLAVAILHDPGDAEDAVQEALLKAWRRFSTFREGNDLRPWLLTIVGNQCRSVRRGRWWSLIRVADPVRVEASHEESSVIGADLRRALLKLGHQQRLTLALHFYLDLPYEEMARVLGTTSQAAKARTHRAMVQLRAIMAAQEEPR
jgi:RNA polymerase sigma-70 factor (ECF subfamily)